MRDSFSFGTTPIDIDPEQVGPNYDALKARQEAKDTIALLRKKFGEEPDGARLRIKSNPHDFGSYLSIECEYDNSYDGAEDYCLAIDNDFPVNWKDDTPVKWKKRKPSYIDLRDMGGSGEY